MKKLKKSLDNNKPVVVFIYGPIAVGKFTIGKILSKKLGYTFAHNHHINDFVAEVFDFHSLGSGLMKDKLRYLLLETMVESGLNIVATHCYAHNYISSAGLSDPEYLKTLEKKITKLGANFYPVHLKTSNKELLRRVGMSSRKRFKKLTDRKIMSELFITKDWQTSPKLKNNFIVDNTNFSPKKVVDMIIEHFKIK